MKKRKPLSIVSSLVCLSLATSFISSCSCDHNTMTAKTSILNPSTHALLIGIGSYINPEVSPLSKPVIDVANMKAFIEKQFNGDKYFTLLTDHKATRNAILAELDKLLDTAKQGDQVVFYYSGHGSQIPDDGIEEKDGMDETLVSADAKFIDGEWQNMIRDDELNIKLKALEDKDIDVLVISDACHSGSITKSAEKSTERVLLADVLQQESYEERRKEKTWLDSSPYRTSWSAVASGQLALENSTLNGSVYTTLLIEGITDKRADYNHNGTVTNGELHRYLLDTSNKYCRLSQCEKGLTPTLEIHPDYISQSFIPSFNKKHGNTKQGSEFTLPDMTTLLEETLAQKLSNDISIKITQKRAIKLGDEVFIGVTSKQSGYLILLDVNSKGELIQIFPNEKVKDNKIEGGKTRYIPENALDLYAIVANEVGKSNMYAIVTYDAIKLSDILNKNKDLLPVEKPRQYAGELAQRLNTPWTEDKISRLSKYAVAKVDYIVHEK